MQYFHLPSFLHTSRIWNRNDNFLPPLFPYFFSVSWLYSISTTKIILFFKLKLSFLSCLYNTIQMICSILLVSFYFLSVFLFFFYFLNIYFFLNCITSLWSGVSYPWQTVSNFMLNKNSHQSWITKQQTTHNYFKGKPNIFHKNILLGNPDIPSSNMEREMQPDVFRKVPERI